MQDDLGVGLGLFGCISHRSNAGIEQSGIPRPIYFHNAFEHPRVGFIANLHKIGHQVFLVELDQNIIGVLVDRLGQFILMKLFPGGRDFLFAGVSSIIRVVKIQQGDHTGFLGT